MLECQFWDSNLHFWVKDSTKKFPNDQGRHPIGGSLKIVKSF